jgi:hypothetical protein
MSRPSLFLSIVAAALLAAMTGAPVRATTHDSLAYLTFSGPVQIPGAILDSGTYRFHLADPDSGRNVIHVLSRDGKTVYSMFHTMPVSRMTVTKEATVTFMEVPAGVAPPVKELFYGGESRGYEFLYGRGEPIMTANVRPQPAITGKPNVTETGPFVGAEPAPAYAEPSAVGSAPAAGTTAGTTAEPEPALPATGSVVPLVGFGGVASLILGLGVALLRRHVA